jgi:hypothetical protein
MLHLTGLFWLFCFFCYLGTGGGLRTTMLTQPRIDSLR